MGKICIKAITNKQQIIGLNVKQLNLKGAETGKNKTAKISFCECGFVQKNLEPIDL